MIQRHFKLALTAGHSLPLVINANQYDSGEQWLFTLYSDGVKYTPSTGAIVGIKADRLGIINTGSVDEAGRVVINETRQMTAAVGKNIFELLIDDQTHGTANFMVLVEPRPGDNADLSESDYSLFEEAIQGTSQTAIIAGVQEWMDENLTDPTDPIVDASLSLAGAAADAKKTGDEISALKSAISSSQGMSAEFKVALETLVNNIVYKGSDPTGRTYINALHNAMYPPASLDSISAVYTQSGVVYDDASLDSLKPDLVVTAHYSDSTSGIVLGYTLNGTLTVGTSTITVSYEGKTTTFNVTVTENPLIYSLLNHVCDGTANTIVTTDILLFNQDQDFTILLDVTTTGQNATPTWRLVDAIRSTDGIQRGISLVEYDSTHAMLRLGEGTVNFTEFSRSYSGKIKFAIRHTVGSGVGKIKIKPASSSAVEYTTSPVVATFSPATDRPLSFGGNYAKTNVFRGTISAYVYNTVLTDTEVNDFLGV